MKAAVILSNIFGVLYSFAWNLSFYPQALENYRNQNVAGYSLEYALLNPGGYLFYTIYTLSGFIDPNLGTGIVSWSDLFFAIHGVALSTLTLAQCYMYKRGAKNNEFQPWCIYLLASCLFMFLASFLIEGGDFPFSMSVHAVSVAGYAKTIITLLKYAPQAWLNYKRKSTAGWSISNVILDFTGGIFSFAQLLTDSLGLGD